MGKIHEALRRAEEQRAGLGGISGGIAASRQMPDDPASVPAPATGGRTRSARRKAKSGRARELRANRRARLVLQDSDSPISEQYRSLRARIQSLRRKRPIRTIAVTSALPGEGKTTTSVNLAACFGLDVERNSVLVDCDMRTPSVHRALNETPELGLAELLQSDAKLDEALIAVPDTRLWALTVRALPTHPAELLASRRMVELIEELALRFETVILDAPPVLGLPDATSIVDLCDAAILVVHAGRPSRRELEETLERIDRTKILGVVFNGSDDVLEPYGPNRSNGVAS